MHHDAEIKFEEPVKDDRFSALLGEDQWRRLPTAIRHRFGKRVRGGASVTYQGTIEMMEMNLAGKLLAHATRLIGAPLPFDLSCVGRSAVVVVTEDAASQGQFWIRQYGRKSGFPQMVHSSKRFGGPTGLEEYIGYGIGIALKVDASDAALFFRSDHYFFSALGLRIRFPRLLSPGSLVIGHHDLGDGRFRFSLTLKNRLLGALLHQDAVFQDAIP